jgi:hypothetical protein
MKNRILTIALLATTFTACKKDDESNLITDPIANASPYISNIFDYQPAPGQNTNSAGLGSLAGAKSLIKSQGNALLSLGGYGGSVVFGFDHPIKNEAGDDLGVFGNPLTGVGMEWSEPGIVCVMQDANGNGLPDDQWYELAGSEYSKAETIKNYQITYYKPATDTSDVMWIDNQLDTGYVLKNPFHDNAMYPATAGNQMTMKGTLLKNTLTEGGIITNKPFEFGYSDSGTPAYVKMQNDGLKAYNGFDLDWAVEANGNKVKLSHINFVKVYTAQNCNGNPYEPLTDNPRSRYMGEISTEISGAIDIHLYQQQTKK